ncbi:MAG: hypothetical protein AAB425_12070 [Bdellovibrionota bacterium]
MIWALEQGYGAARTTSRAEDREAVSPSGCAEAGCVGEGDFRSWDIQLHACAAEVLPNFSLPKGVPT